MPRDVSGTYALPSGKLPTNGTASDATEISDIFTDLQTDLNTDRPIVAGGTGASTASAARTNLGLGSVDNTSDADKPVSTATQTALNLKADFASPAFTGTPTAPTAAAGTNTTQLATTAYVETALTDRAPLASPALTGNPTAPTQSESDNSTKLATTAYADRAGLTLNESPAFSVGDYTWTHGLGAQPKLVQLWVVCTSNYNGWIVGDETLLNSEGISGTGSVSITVRGSTSIIVSINSIRLRSPTDTDSNVTNANFDFIIRAWT